MGLDWSKFSLNHRGRIIVEVGGEARRSFSRERETTQVSKGIGTYPHAGGPSIARI
jgi:hypothetical protein